MTQGRMAPGHLSRLLLGLSLTGLLTVPSPLALSAGQAQGSRTASAQASPDTPVSPSSSQPASASSPASGEAAALHSGDRIVFLGDSITAGHFYTRYMELFLRLRHPELELMFINSGIGGHTAADGLNRLTEDVFAFQPTVVMVNFGMNDAGASPTAKPGMYEKNMVTLLDKVMAQPGVRLVVWLDTTPFDIIGAPKGHKGFRWEARIRELVTFTHEEAQKRGIPVVSWHGTMLAALEKYKAVGRSGRLIPDRVHPSLSGHVIMALEALQTLGFDLTPTALQGKWQEGKLVLAGPGLTTSELPWDGRSSLTTELKGLISPVPLRSEYPAGEPIPQEALEISKLILRLEGLPGAAYQVSVDGRSLGQLTGQELSQGVDLLRGLNLEPAMRTGKRARQEARCDTPDRQAWPGDYYCLMDLIQRKDQIRQELRPDHLTLLPRYPNDYFPRYEGFMIEWLEASNKALNERDNALNMATHTLRLEAVQ